MYYYMLPDRRQSTSLGGEFTFLTQAELRKHVEYIYIDIYYIYIYIRNWSTHLCQCQTNIVYTTTVKGQRQHAGQVMYNEVMHAWVSGIFLGGWIEALHWVHASADRGLLISWFDCLCFTLELTVAPQRCSPTCRDGSRHLSRPEINQAWNTIAITILCSLKCALEEHKNNTKYRIEKDIQQKLCMYVQPESPSNPAIKTCFSASGIHWALPAWSQQCAWTTWRQRDSIDKATGLRKRHQLDWDATWETTPRPRLIFKDNLFLSCTNCFGPELLENDLTITFNYHLDSNMSSRKVAHTCTLLKEWTLKFEPSPGSVHPSFVWLLFLLLMQTLSASSLVIFLMPA